MRVKNYVFGRKMWNDDKKVVKNFLIERINCAAPNIIINCCTKGDSENKPNEELRYIVQEELNTKFGKSGCLLLRAAHPLSYHFKNGLSWVDVDEK